LWVSSRVIRLNVAVAFDRLTDDESEELTFLLADREDEQLIRLPPRLARHVALSVGHASRASRASTETCRPPPCPTPRLCGAAIECVTPSRARAACG
jgi:hypothetical protein